jgi:hypothetical protein
VVFDLCRKIFPAFSKEDRKVASALLHLRNEEVHSGAAAFDQYSPSHWLIGFYHACQSLSTVLGETLGELFGEDEAKFAERLLAENRDNLRNTVLTAIAAYKKVFSTRDPGEQKALRAQAEELAGELSAKRHHRVVCPSCGCTATLQGTPFGKEHVTHEEEGAIVVRQAVSPTDFSCSACGLKLSTYAEVETAGLGEHYTRTTTYSPEDYYGLINPDDLDSYLASQAEDVLEFDNE